MRALIILGAARVCQNLRPPRNAEGGQTAPACCATLLRRAALRPLREPIRTRISLYGASRARLRLATPCGG
jgi:hypothetical protein